MPKIHVLPEIVANKIAAGEVIERPASIVKELMENSLDAGASSIDVSIQHGGKSLIRVADNGYGMSHSDVELAFQRHATSKIDSAEDLNRIMTFGFRGEALPSIAAVSRVRVRTRARGEESGTELVIEGGIVKSLQETSCREGTIVEVQDLFFNTPARRKFLRTDATERGHIMDVVGNVALAMTESQVTLQSGDKELWQFTAEESLAARACLVLGIPDLAEWLPFAAEGKAVRISGLIGKPRILRSNRSGQIFFVNRRMIKALSLSYALRDGYHGLLMNGQYPLGVIFVDVDPTRVDVNVHPSKREVRLSNEREVKGILKRAIAECLGQAEDMAPFLRTSSRSTSLLGASGRVTSGAKVTVAEEVGRPYEGQAQGVAGTVKDAWNPADIPTFHAPRQEKTLVETISLRNKLQITKVLGQIHHTYIVAETDEGLVLIDQHAAHERVMFEEMVQNLRTGEVKQQGLLLNEVLEVHPKQQEIMQDSLPLLERLGFELDSFGEHEYVIRSVPATLQNTDPIACLRRFLDQKEAGAVMTDLDKHQEEVAALIACKSRSVKAKDSLRPEGIEALLEQLARCENPFNCPHGRPTVFNLTIDELEKQFRRKV